MWGGGSGRDESGWRFSRCNGVQWSRLPYLTKSHHLLHAPPTLIHTSPHFRLRQPNEWESPLHWQDVLMWRNQIHNIVINAFGSAE